MFLLLTATASVSSRNTLESNCIKKNHLTQLHFWSSISIHLLLDLLCPRANESLSPVMSPHNSVCSTEQLWPFSLLANLDLPGNRLSAWCSASYKPHSQSKSSVAVWSLITEPQLAACMLPQEQRPQPHIFVLRAGLPVLSLNQTKLEILESGCKIKISLFYEYFKNTECVRSMSVSSPVCILWATCVLAMLWAELNYLSLWAKKKKGKCMP